MSSIDSLDPSFEPTLQRLREVRLGILRLHKALLNTERSVYENIYGPIQSTGEFFRLVLDSEWFSWLRPMSQFIVQMDDVLMSKDPVALDEIEVLLAKATTLLQPAEEGTAAEMRYYDAIQRDPEIALMHAALSELLATGI